MATSLEALQAQVAQLDAAIAAVAAKVAELSANSLSPDQVNAALQPEVDKLNALVQPPQPPVG